MGGDFIGHLENGIGWSAMGLWWIFHMLWDYNKSIRTGTTFKSRCSYSLMIRGRRVPIEIILKVACVCIVMSVLLWKHHWNVISAFTFVRDDGRFISIGKMQHLTVLLSFATHWMIDLLNYFKVTRSTLTKKFRYVTLSFAYFWFSYLFIFHTLASTNKPPLELVLHRMDIILGFAISVTTMLEMTYRTSFLLQYVRGWLTLVIGTWFVQISWILYTHTAPRSHPNPDWDRFAEQNVGAVVPIFGLHLIFTNVGILVAYAIIAAVTSFMSKGKVKDKYKWCAKMFGNGVVQKREYEAVPLINDESELLDV